MPQRQPDDEKKSAERPMTGDYDPKMTPGSPGHSERQQDKRSDEELHENQAEAMKNRANNQR